MWICPKCATHFKQEPVVCPRCGPEAPAPRVLDKKDRGLSFLEQLFFMRPRGVDLQRIRRPSLIQYVPKTFLLTFACVLLIGLATAAIRHAFSPGSHDFSFSETVLPFAVLGFICGVFTSILLVFAQGIRESLAPDDAAQELPVDLSESSSELPSARDDFAARNVCPEKSEGRRHNHSSVTLDPESDAS